MWLVIGFAAGGVMGVLGGVYLGMLVAVTLLVDAGAFTSAWEDNLQTYVKDKGWLK